MIQSIDQQFISSQSSSKRGKILVQPHFIVRLNFLSQIISSLSYRTYGTKPLLRQLFSKISIVHRSKMQMQILLSLLFAASVSGRPTGREIAQVSFLEKKLWKKKFIWAKKTGSYRLKRTQQQFFIHLRSVSNLLKEMTSTSFKPDFVHADSNRT